jgi:hypothetical protein
MQMEAIALKILPAISQDIDGILSALKTTKYVGAIKYKTPKPVAHAARALQVLDLVFNYAHILI